jgi:hypothetical protein
MSRKSIYNVEIHIEANAAIISITASTAFRLKTFITNFVGIYVTSGNSGCVFVRQWLADRLDISSMTRLVSLSNQTSPSWESTAGMRCELEYVMLAIIVAKKININKSKYTFRRRPFLWVSDSVFFMVINGSSVTFH